MLFAQAFSLRGCDPLLGMNSRSFLGQEQNYCLRWNCPLRRRSFRLRRDASLKIAWYSGEGSGAPLTCGRIALFGGGLASTTRFCIVAFILAMRHARTTEWAFLRYIC